MEERVGPKNEDLLVTEKTHSLAIAKVGGVPDCPVS